MANVDSLDLKKRKSKATTFDANDKTYRLSSSSRHQSSEEAEEVKVKKVRQLSEKLVWILCTFGFLYFTGYFHMLWKQLQEGGLLVYGSLLCATGIASICFYLLLIMPKFYSTVLNVEHWRTDAPKSITASAILGTIIYVFLTIAVWGKYSIFSPIVTLLLYVGILNFLVLF